MTSETVIPACDILCPIHGVPAIVTSWKNICLKCEEDRDRERERERAIGNAESRLAASGIPRRFQEFFLDGLKATTPAQAKVLTVARSYARNFADNYSHGRCLIFCGNIGTGKSTLACCIAQSLITTAFLPGSEERPGIIYRPQYTTASEVVRKVRDTWHTKTSTTSVIEDFVRVHLLILDEMGAQAGTDAERAQIFELIDLRYQELRPTIVITNCDREGLNKVLGERAVDRLADHGGQLCVFNWASYRK